MRWGCWGLADETSNARGSKDDVDWSQPCLALVASSYFLRHRVRHLPRHPEEGGQEEDPVRRGRPLRSIGLRGEPRVALGADQPSGYLNAAFDNSFTVQDVVSLRKTGSVS